MKHKVLKIIFFYIIVVGIVLFGNMSINAVSGDDDDLEAQE